MNLVMAGGGGGLHLNEAPNVLVHSVNEEIEMVTGVHFAHKSRFVGLLRRAAFQSLRCGAQKLPLPKMSPDPECRVQSFPFPGLPKESQSSCEELL